MNLVFVPAFAFIKSIDRCHMTQTKWSAIFCDCKIVNYWRHLLIECQKIVASHQAYHPKAWTYNLSIQGPGRNVKISGTLKPLKRSADEAGLPRTRPFTMVRSCDTMMAQIREDARRLDETNQEVQATQEFDTVLDD